jgi:dGTPase
VDLLERDGRGLNLTFEVRDGILQHSKGKGEILAEDAGDMPCTYEGKLVRIADIIAYVNHDIDDATRAGLILPEDIPRDCLGRLGDSHGRRIDTMVKDIIEQAQGTEPLKIGLSENVLEATVRLRDFLYERVYDLPQVHADFHKSAKILRELYAHYLGKKDAFRQEAGEAYTREPVERAIADFIAGMTDRYAFKRYEEIFLPRPWLVV